MASHSGEKSVTPLKMHTLSSHNSAAGNCTRAEHGMGAGLLTAQVFVVIEAGPDLQVHQQVREISRQKHVMG